MIYFCLFQTINLALRQTEKYLLNLQKMTLFALLQKQKVQMVLQFWFCFNRWCFKRWFFHYLRSPVSFPKRQSFGFSRRTSTSFVYPDQILSAMLRKDNNETCSEKSLFEMQHFVCFKQLVLMQHMKRFPWLFFLVSKYFILGFIEVAKL